MGYHLLPNGSAPSTPAAGYIALYTKSANKRLFMLDELGYETDLTQAARANNYLINGDFAVCQRLATPTTLTQGILAGVANTYGGYVLDRWYITCETLTSADVKAAQIDESANSNASAFSMQVQNANAATKRVACSQVLEFKDSYRLRGRNVVFQCKSKISTTARNLRMAIISAKTSSTKDSFSAAQKDIVNTWSSTTYTTGNFFKATSGNWTYTVVAVSGSLAQTTNYSSVQSITGSVPTDCQNLICIIWDENGAPTTESMNILEAGLFDGQIAQDWNPRSFAAELSLAQRYFYGLPSDANDAVFLTGGFSSTSVLKGRLQFPVTMRAKPAYALSGTIGHITIENSSGAATSAGTASSLSSNSDSNGAYMLLTGTGTPYTALQTGDAFWNAGAGDVLWFDAEL